MKILISGGGTGGHFFPALALIECLIEKGFEPLYVGSHRGIEKSLADRIPVKSLFVYSHPFMGRTTKDKLFALVKLLMGSFQVSKHMSGRDRGVVFGGYASLPLGLACLLRRVPLYIHEQNSIPSKTNSLLSRFARKVFLTFEFSRKYFPEDRAVRTGLPVRKALLEGVRASRQTALEKLGLEDRNTLLVVGGSQGAGFLNEIAMKLFSKTGWQGIHITGEKDYERIRDFYITQRLKVCVLPFSHEMETVYRASTIALSRAGASTITELSLYGIPALFIPFPHAIADHQFYNAKEIEELGGGLVLRQENATEDEIKWGLERLMADHETFARNIRTFANPLACEDMVKYIFSEGGL